MLNIRASTARAPSPRFVNSPRKKREDNVAWLTRNLPAGLKDGTRTAMLLLGGTGTVDVRLRVAQSHARHDMSPSHWSHAALLPPPDGDLSQAALYEVSLRPVGGFGFPPATNAVQKGMVKAYASAEEFPNVAVLSAPVKWQDLEGPLMRFQQQRAVLDAVELLMHWLAFAWGVGKAGNPLLDGHGIPSAAMLEFVAAAVGFELTPGLASRSSCPEALWQSAKWWHDYYGRDDGEGVLTGAWHHSHYLVPEA